METERRVSFENMTKNKGLRKNIDKVLLRIFCTCLLLLKHSPSPQLAESVLGNGQHTAASSVTHTVHSFILLGITHTIKFPPCVPYFVFLAAG